MEIKVDYVEDLLWLEGIEFELTQNDEEMLIRVLGLMEIVEVKPVWPNEEGELIFDSDDIYVYVGDEFFGQLSVTSAEDLVEELDKILENYR